MNSIKATLRIIGAFAMLGILFACQTASEPVMVKAGEAPEELAPVAANVPAKFAVWNGGWRIAWTSGGYVRDLWVTGVQADGSLKAAYISAGETAFFGNYSVKDGTLTVACGSGSCTFRHRGDYLDGEYSDSQGRSNSGSARRIVVK